MCGQWLEQAVGGKEWVVRQDSICSSTVPQARCEGKSGNPSQDMEFKKQNSGNRIQERAWYYSNQQKQKSGDRKIKKLKLHDCDWIVYNLKYYLNQSNCNHKTQMHLSTHHKPKLSS